jgi:hypothetical protein
MHEKLNALFNENKTWELMITFANGTTYSYDYKKLAIQVLDTSC